MATAAPTPGPTDTPAPTFTPTPTPTPTPTDVPAPPVDGTAAEHLAHIAASLDLLVGIVIVCGLTWTFILCVGLVRNLR